MASSGDRRVAVTEQVGHQQTTGPLTGVPAVPSSGPSPGTGSVPSQASDDTSDAATCIFCDRPSGSVAYAWPEWLCRLLTQNPRIWGTGGKDPANDVLRLERMRREIDQTVTSVCDVCSRGWMQRLEDRVSPFLQSMIVGDLTALTAVRRRLLARWAAKTAVVMECASQAPFRTPKFASEFVRRVGVHPGTQVLLGKYDGDRRCLAHERDVFTRMIDGEKCHIPQASFVIGSVFIQVFSDPWRQSAPEPSEQAAMTFIPLVGNDSRTVVWPPETSIDDERFDLERCGPNDDVEDLPGPREFHQGRMALVSNGDVGGMDMLPGPASHANLARRRPLWRAPGRRPDVSTAPTFNGGMHAAAGGTPDTHGTPPTEDPAGSPTFPRRGGKRLASGAVIFVVAVVLGGYGLHERSSAARWRASSLSWQARVDAHNSQNQPSSATHPTIGPPTTTTNVTVTTASRPSAGDANTTRLAAQPGRLTQIVNTIPSVTRGLEQCASAALATASDALNFAATFPNATTNAVNADSTAVSSVCGNARAAANTLDDLVKNRTP